jgi:tetratricopeptide (TPR) repeat protein
VLFRSGPAEKAEYFMGQAGLAIAEGDESTALDYYLAAAEVYDEIGEETVDRAEAHFYAADYLYKFSHREQAIEEYDAAVRIYLKYADNSQIKAAVALNNMGSIHRELHEKSKARSCWERALQIYKNASEERKNHQHIAKIEQNLRDLAEGF